MSNETKKENPLEILACQAIELERLNGIIAGVRKALNMSDRIDASWIPRAVAAVVKKVATERKDGLKVLAEVFADESLWDNVSCDWGD